MNIYVFLDRPSQDNDKKWLVDALVEEMKTKETKIIPVYTSFITSIVYRKGGLVKFRVLYEYLKLSLKILSKSNKNDVVICWTPLIACILYKLANVFRTSRRIISMNWINPGTNSFLRKIEKSIASDPQARVIVNTLDSIELFSKKLDIKREDAFCCIPDVYDERIPFKKNEKPHVGSYFFTGGINNRDWKLVAQLAREFPSQSFVCCALKDDFCSLVKEIPNNMKVYFNVQPSEYYQYLSDSYAVLLPLRSQMISGLINIIRSAQEGILCLASSTPSTKQYYCDEVKDLLLCSNPSEWTEKVNQVLALSEEDYICKCHNFSSYIENEFTPQKTVKKILNAIPPLNDSNGR